MRILFIGDIHIKNKTLIQFHNFKRWLQARLTQDPVPEIVILLGDVLDKMNRIEQNLMQEAHHLFKMVVEKNIPLYVLVGNHDLRHATQALTEAHWMLPYKFTQPYLLHIVDQFTPLMLSNLPELSFSRLLLCPWMPDHTFLKAIQDYGGEDWKNSFDLIVAHQTFWGAMNNAHFDKGENYPEDAPFLISGHIHQSMQPQANLLYAGSILATCAGESNEKYAWLCELSEEAPVFTAEPVQFLTRRDIHCNMKELTQVWQRALAELTKDENLFLRIIATGSPVEVAAYKKGRDAGEEEPTRLQLIFRRVQPLHSKPPLSSFSNPMNFKARLQQELLKQPRLMQLLAKLQL